MGLSGSEGFIILLVAVLVFGSGKISALLGDLAKGLTTFKKTMNEPDTEPPKASLPVEPPRERQVRGSKPRPETRRCARRAGS
jgi:sec-independent protein translocase protein TatA